MTVEVRPVRGLGDLRRFINLPYRLHAGTKWIPPVREERYLFLIQKLNAFFTHGEGQYFLAWDGGRVVGRITAHIDHAYNAFHHSRTGMFGFVEFEDDQAIVDALLAAAERWLRARSCELMLGPMDFTLNDEGGILIKGFELEPMVRHPWQPPLLPAPDRGRRAREGDGPLQLVAGRLRPRPARSAAAAHRPARPRQARRDDPAHDPPHACARTSTSSPRSTTPPGRPTGGSPRTPRPTSTPTGSTSS